MAHPNHDALVAAFQRVGGKIYTCDRGHPDNGYTHIHGPNHRPAAGVTRCTDSAVAIEKFNGTVVPRDPIGAQMGGRSRPQVSIKKDPLGYSHGKNYGAFHTGFDFEAVRVDWSSLDAFATEVIKYAKQHQLW